MRTIQELTDQDGNFDREIYLEEIKKKSPVHVVKNQKTILDWLPTTEDDVFIASEKNLHCEILVKKMYSRNTEKQ